MAICRWWMLCFIVVVGWLGSASAATPGDAATPEISKLIGLLHADSHAVRDAALVEIVRLGQKGTAELLKAASSGDVETAWRSEEALRLVCRTVDDANAVALRGQLTSVARAKNSPAAAVAGRTLKFWKFFRHDYAASQLEARGALIVDSPVHPQSLTESVPVAVPGVIGAFLGGKPRLAEGFIVEEFAADLPVVEAAAEEKPKEEAAPEEAPKKDDPAPEVKKDEAVGLRGLFKVLERAAVKVGKVGFAADEAIAEVFEKKMERELRRLEGVAGGEAAADVEIIEAAPVVDAVPAIAAPIMVDFGGGGRFMPWMAGGAGIATLPLWTYADSEMVVSEGATLSPGMLRIDESWRGGDSDLRFLAELQGIHTVSLRSAVLTDAALAHVAKMPTLQRLEVAGTQMTGAALVKLRQQKPQITIVARGVAVVGVACIDHPQGPLARQVIPETGARRAGIAEGDILTKIDGLRIANFADMVLALYDKQPGDKVKVEYRRGIRTDSCLVTLTDRESSGQGADTRMVQQQPQMQYQTWGGGPVFMGGGMMMPGMAMPAMGIDFAVPAMPAIAD